LITIRSRKVFPCPKHLDHLWDLLSLLISEHRAFFRRVLSGRGVNLNTVFHLLPSSGVSSAAHVCPHNMRKDDYSTDVRRLTTGIRSKKCVVKRFRRCANVYLHKPRQYSIAYYTPRLYDIAYCYQATNL
jgi:hypothetical protein